MTATLPSPDICWNALIERDRSFDGQLYFAVVTTGVFCRPSCPARQPKRENVRFYATPQDAQNAGFRACKRCRPLDEISGKAAWISDLATHLRTFSDAKITLSDLAARANVTPEHVQREFKAALGMSPRQYQEACRMQRFKASLQNGTPVTDAVYEAGFGSSSRAYERSDARLGMTPTQYRKGAPNITISWTLLPTPLGSLLVAATDRGLCSVQFCNSVEAATELLQEFRHAHLEQVEAPYSPAMQLYIDALEQYFAGTRSDLQLPVDVQASAFQERVWRYLQEIPYGTVQSYGEVAKALGHPKAFRAVARACATNRVGVVIPCHRVLRGTGHLGGYRWGLDRKRDLIAMEASSKP